MQEGFLYFSQIALLILLLHLSLMGLFGATVKLFRKLCLAVLGFILGLTCGLLLYEFVLSETSFDDSYKVLMFFSTAAFLSLGFAFSRQIRCISILTIPEFATSAGRRSVQATILILVLAGPMKNIGDNGEETVRFLVCIKDMLLEILVEGKDLILAPIQHIFYDIKAAESPESDERKYNISALKDLMSPIVMEVEDEREIVELKDENDDIDEALGIEPRSGNVESHFKSEESDSTNEKIEKTYRKKLAYRCEEVFSKGTSKCVEMFQGKYDECYDKVTPAFGWALCWPMKLNFICDVLNMFAQDRVCDMTDLVESGFGESYSVAKKGIDDFSKSFKVQVNYQGLTEMINLDGLKETKEDILNYYLEGRKYVEWYLTIIKRGLALSYLFVVFGALDYHGKYFAGLSSDNIYITPYFRRIDERRRYAGKTSVLPLKSFERSNFSRLNRIQLTHLEWKKFGDQLFAILIQAGVVFTIFGFDFVYTELLQLVQDHADMHIHQEGQHVLDIEVKGTSLLARLLRLVIKDFNVHKKIDISHYSKPCLPIPRVTPKAYYQRVMLLFLVLLISSYFESHCIRCRHCIANYFYPKRSRKRTVWLYNETLKRRKGKESHLKRRVLENSDKFLTHVSRNPLVLLAEAFPNKCRCLRRWKVARRNCVVCKRNGEVFRCPVCKFSFCEECFQDVDKKCLYCVAKKEIEFKSYLEIRKHEGFKKV